MLSGFRRHAQRNAFHRDVRQQSRSFCLWNPEPKPNPNSNRLSSDGWRLFPSTSRSGFCDFCPPQSNDFFSLRVPEFPLKLNCHASITKRDSFRRLDQVLCDSDCLADHHLSGFDNRLRDVRLALGSVNRLAGRFAEICSAFKSDSRTISNSHN